MAKQYSSQPELRVDLAKTYTATVKTNHGDINIDLNVERSPQAVNNFVFLARDGFYDGVVFHRVIDGFMIQGGDPTGSGMGGPGYKFRDEIEGSGEYIRGTVAMANAGPNTNGSQFFIMHKDMGLPHAYTIFGNVTDGLDVVDSIADVSTDSNDRPQEEVKISTIEINEEG